MASLSVDGLVSGLDTTALISQLVSAEGATQTRLQARKTATQTAATAYRSINTKVDGLRAAAEDLAKATTWAAAKATSSSSAATVAATGTPQTGQLSFTVETLATAHALMSDDRWGTTGTDFGAAQVTFTTGGTTTSVAVGGTGTLSDAVKAINASNAGVTAAAVHLEDGQYALMVTAKKTGVANTFSIGGTGTFSPLVTATDAKVHLGGPTGPAVTSATNTFSDLLAGGAITVTATSATPVTISVVADPDAVATKMQAFVDAANAALAEIKKHTNSGSAGAALKGDLTLSRLTGNILDSVSRAVGTDSAGTAGVQLTREGTVKFDKTTFLTSLQSAPDRTQRLFAGGGTPAVEGIGSRMQAVAKAATDATTGSLTILAKGKDSLAKTFEKQIDDWDIRLAARKATLTRQFTAMETALSSLKSQSSWLSGQLASLS
ncbi:MAG: Flagellar hook-associated protein 2 [Blastococcus sp.]|jgi:flagellar hook-associated protein 2|nr:Flagellar hook-associated protein 2 [Blastococcus sp.]